MEGFPFEFDPTRLKELSDVLGGADGERQQASESESEFEDNLTSEYEDSFTVENDDPVTEDEDAGIQNIHQDRGKGKRQIKPPKIYTQDVADAQKDLNSLDETSLTEILSKHSSLDKSDDKKGHHTDRKERYQKDDFVAPEDEIVYATEQDDDRAAVSTKNIIKGERKNKGQDNREHLIDTPQFANVLNKAISEKTAERDAKQEKKDDKEARQILESFVLTQADKGFIDNTGDNNMSSDGEYSDHATDSVSDHATDSGSDHDDERFSDPIPTYNIENNRKKPNHDGIMSSTAQEPSNNKREEGVAKDPGAPYRHAEWEWDKIKERNEYKELEFYKADSPYEVHNVLFRKGKFSNVQRIEALQDKYDGEDEHKYWFKKLSPSSDKSRKVDPTPARPNGAVKPISNKSKQVPATKTKTNGKATTRKTKKVRAKKDERSNIAPNRPTTKNAKSLAKNHKAQPSNNKKNDDTTQPSQLKQHILVTIGNEPPMRVVLKNYTSSKLLKLDAKVIKNKFIRFKLTGGNQTTVVQGIDFYNASSKLTIKIIIDIAKSDSQKNSKSSPLPINKKDVVDLLTPDEGAAVKGPAPGASKARLQDDQNKIDKYIKDMRKRIRWGGEIEVRAAYQLYKISIRLFDVYDNNWGKVYTYPSKDEYNAKLDNTTINLLRTNRDHYDLIVRTEKKTPPTTRRSSGRHDKFLMLTEQILGKNDKMMAFCILDKKSPANKTNNGKNYVPIKIIKIKKDGNCLFQSIFCFFKRQNLHKVMNLKNGMDVRQEICDYIQRNDELKNMILVMIEGDEADKQKNKTKKKERQQTKTQPTSSKENHTSPNVTKQLKDENAVTNSKKPKITGPTNKADKTSQLNTTSLLQLLNHPAWEMEGYVENDQYIIGKRKAKTMWIKSKSPVPNFSKAKSILDNRSTSTLRVFCNHFFLDVKKCGLVSSRLIVWTIEKTNGGTKYHKTKDTTNVWKQAQVFLNNSFRSNREYLNLNITKQNCYLLLDYDKLHALQNDLNDKILKNVGLQLQFSIKLLPEENELATLKNLKKYVTAKFLMHTRRNSSNTLALYPKLYSPQNKMPNILINSEKFLYTSSYFVKLTRIAETGQVKFPIYLVIWRINKQKLKKLWKNGKHNKLKNFIKKAEDIVQKIHQAVVSTNDDILKMFQEKINQFCPDLIFHTLFLIQLSKKDPNRLHFQEQLENKKISKLDTFPAYLQPNNRIETFNFLEAFEELFGLVRMQKYIHTTKQINQLLLLRQFKALQHLNLNQLTLPFAKNRMFLSESLKLLRISNCTIRLTKTNEGYPLPNQLTHLNMNRIYIESDVLSETSFVKALKLPQYLIHLNLSSNHLHPEQILQKIISSNLDLLQSLNLNGNRNRAYKHQGCHLQFHKKDFRALQHLFLSSTYLKALTLSIPLLELDVSCNLKLNSLKVESLKSLTTLNITQTGIQDIDFVDLPRLSTLRCCQNKFNFQEFKLPKTLQCLYLSNIKNTAHEGRKVLIQRLTEYTPNLMYLDISNNHKNLEKNDFSNLNLFEELRGLNLRKNYLDMKTLNKSLALLGNDLKYLHLGSNYLYVYKRYPEFAETIFLQNIVSLNLSRSNFISKHFNATDLPPSLKYLNLSAIGPLKENNVNFSRLLQLRQLDLSYNKFTAAHFLNLQLTQCTNLKLLHVHGNPIEIKSKSNKSFHLPNNLEFIRFDNNLPKKINCETWKKRTTLQRLRPFPKHIKNEYFGTIIGSRSDEMPQFPEHIDYDQLTDGDIKYIARKNRLERVYETDAYQAFKSKKDMLFNYKRIEIADEFIGVRENKYFDYLTFRAVLLSIDTEPYEICGYVTHMEPSLHSMHFYKTDQGPAVSSKTQQKGVCKWSKTHPILWHTHIDGLPFWPSQQDLLKPLKNKEVHTSLVVGKYYSNEQPPGEQTPKYIVWIITNHNLKMPKTTTVHEAYRDIEKMLRKYFWEEEKGFIYNSDKNNDNNIKYYVNKEPGLKSIKEFKLDITRYINNKFEDLTHPYTLKILIFDSTHRLEHII